MEYIPEQQTGQRVSAEFEAEILSTIWGCEAHSIPVHDIHYETLYEIGIENLARRVPAPGIVLIIHSVNVSSQRQSYYSILHIMKL